MARHLTPRHQAIKVATRAAVSAAGGQVDAAQLPDVRVGQSSLSHYGNNTNPEHGEAFIPVDVAIAIERCTRGQPGHPHILRTYAAQLDFLLVPRPDVAASGDWGRKLKLVGLHFGKVSASVCAALGDARSPGEVTAEEVRAANLIAQLDDLAETVARMRALAASAIEPFDGAQDRPFDGAPRLRSGQAQDGAS